MINKRFRKINLGGYMTMEAALVVPAVCIVIVVMLGILFYQYDRCLIEQNLGIMLIRGTCRGYDDNASRVNIIMSYASALDWNQYLICEEAEVECDVENRELHIVWKSGFGFPIGRNGKIEKTISARLISPVFMLRQFRKLDRMSEKD
ncbi:MAG: hypothetical protein K6G30_05950 [Acetatifactor sp.]|nr:hypothetical protein [Acetatifactor sp.]